MSSGGMGSADPHRDVVFNSLCHENTIAYRDIQLCVFGLAIKGTSGQKFKCGRAIVSGMVTPDSQHIIKCGREGLSRWF